MLLCVRDSMKGENTLSYLSAAFLNWLWSIWMSWVGGWCFMTVQLNRASSGCTVAIIYKSSLVFCKRGFMRYLGICNLFRTVANCHQLQFGETDNRERFTTQIWKLVVLWYSHGILFIILSHAIDPIISRNYFWKYCR